MTANKIILLAAAASLLLCACTGQPASGPDYRYDKMQREQLGRGLVAIHNGGGRVSVSWRFLYG